MEMQTERFIVDRQGNRVAVVLDIAEYERLLDEIEDREASRAYDETMADIAAGREEVIPLNQAIAEIERNRK